MNNQFGKQAKWKRVAFWLTQIILYPVHWAIRLVAQFVLLLAALAAFLIPPLILIGLSIVLALSLGWNPESLESPWAFEIDKLIRENADIITIITLLINACLISLLLWKDRCKSLLYLLQGILRSLSNTGKKISEIFKEKWLPKMDIKESLSVTWRYYFAKVWPSMKEMFPESRKLVSIVLTLCIYPVHFVIRIAARFLLLAIRSAILILILILLVISIVSFNALQLTLSKGLELILSTTSKASPEPFIIMIIILSIAIILIPHLFQGHAKNIWKSLLNIKERIGEVLRGRWLPELDIKESLSVTWQYYGEKITPSFFQIVTESRKLFFSTLILCIALWGYVKVLEAAVSPKEWTIFSFPKILDIPREVAKHSHPVTEHSHPVTEHSHKPSTSYPFKKDTQFSLYLYYGEGDLKTKKNICPEGSNLEWLKLFKTTIADGTKDGRIKLKVEGFASVAPVLVNGDTTKSDSLNYEIANQRAEALIYFLTTKPYDSTVCKTGLKNDLRWGRVEGKPHTRGRPDTLAWKGSGFTVTYDDSPRVQWESPYFTVAYKPWKNYKDMEKNKPMKYDPQEGRQRDIEFLNRSVKITIEGDSCLTKAVPASQ